jgi:hypothetical protein
MMFINESEVLRLPGLHRFKTRAKRSSNSRIELLTQLSSYSSVYQIKPTECATSALSDETTLLEVLHDRVPEFLGFWFSRTISAGVMKLEKFAYLH